MKIRIPVLVAACAVLLTSAALEPPAAYAQRRVAVRVAPRSAVVIRPYYYQRPYYDSWYFGYPWRAGYYGVRVYGSPYAYDASLRLQVTPRDTEVYVDGYFAGTVDDYDGVFQRLHLEPGEHELELYLPGHRSTVQRVYLQPGRTSRLRHTMQPLAPGDPDPVKPTAQSPSDDIRPLPRPGTARRPADPRRAEPREAGGGADARDPAYGSLSFRVQPGDATVLIDGERWEGAQGDERLVVELAAGRHVIDVQKDGYRRYTTEITVRAGETTTLNIALTRN